MRWVPVDEVVVPISVDTDASLGDYQGSGRDVDKRAARPEAKIECTLGALLIGTGITDRTTSMSPLKHSRTSRTKKSVLGNPIPVLAIEMGTPLYLPVIVMNPLSEVSLNGIGALSRCSAIISALDGDPTAT